MTAEELQAHLFALEERLVHPDREVDRSNLIPLLADDFKEFGCSGRVYNRSQILEILTTTHARSATISHFCIEPLAESAVLATYHLTTPTSVTLRSSIWIYRGQHWQMLFHQGTAAI